MTKSELIDQIASVNRSATHEFLSSFTNRELADYVRQLASLGLLPNDESTMAAGTMGTPHAMSA